MKVLFFLTSSMEKPSPSWHLMKALLEDVLNAGIHIYAIQRHYDDVEGKAFPDSILNHPGFSYSTVPVGTPTPKTAFVRRYLDGIKYALKAIKHYRHHNDFDVVFVQSAPTSLFYILLARYFAKKRPVIYNSQDMFPGSAIANGSMPKKWMQKIFYKLQKIAYKKVDVITAISEDMKQKLIEQGVPESKIRVIVNWYDSAEVHEIAWDENNFVKKYNLDKSKFYVQYAGTMGTNFNPEPILQVAQRLKNNSQIEFQMIGNGVKRERFEARAKELNLNNIVFYPLQPQSLVPDVYSTCSVCLIPLMRGVIGNSVPSKAGLLMACRRVIVNSVDIDSDYARIFEEERIGFSCDTTDYDGLTDKITYLYNNPREYIEIANRAKAYGQKFYSREYNTTFYIELFNTLVQ